MNVLLGITFVPLICLSATLIIGLVILFTLRRGTRTISDYVENQKGASDTSSDTSGEAVHPDTRWARSDLKGEAELSAAAGTTSACPACGGENPSGSAVCQYCGRKL